ncbi:MAG: RNA methyltransferase, partial [Synechococcus sp.]|nr:RNA methyltransferase [Synechococcus sp.]
AVVVPDLLTAINDCRRTVGSCGRLDHGEIPLQTPEEALGWLLAGDGSPSSTNAPVALVFGREDRGLSNSELRLCQRVLCLQSGEAYPSLNLSHAVAVVLHELARLNNGTTATRSIDPPSPDPAAAKALSACLDDATDLLLEAGFLLEHTAAARMAKVRDLLQRATVRAEEVALLRGMVRQLRWAIRAKRP